MGIIKNKLKTMIYSIAYVLPLAYVFNQETRAVRLSDVITMSPESERNVGTIVNDLIHGMEGDDKIYVILGDAHFYGHFGNDVLYRGGGNGCDIFNVSAFENSSTSILDIEACDTLIINFDKSCGNTLVYDGEDLNTLTDSFISPVVTIYTEDNKVVICAGDNVCNNYD